MKTRIIKFYGVFKNKKTLVELLKLSSLIHNKIQYMQKDNFSFHQALFHLPFTSINESSTN